MADTIRLYPDGSTLPPSTENDASDWMRKNLQTFGELPLKEAVWLPGSHDAGMYTCLSKTSAVTDGHVITQRVSIYDQLRCGIRWFDVRPMLAADGSWSCGHYSSTSLGWKGGSGVPILSVISQVQKFLSEHAELVILEVSHVLRATDGSATTAREKEELLSMFKSNLSSMYRLPFRNGITDISKCTLRQLIGSGKGLAAVTVSDEGDAGDHPENNFTSSVFRNLDLARMEYFTDGSHATVQQSDFQAVASLITSVIGSDLLGSDVLSLASELPSKCFPWLAQDMTKYATTSTGARNTAFARISQFDDVHNADPLTFALAANYAETLLRQPEKFEPPVVVVYGGKRVTSPDVLHNIYNAAIQFDRYPVLNESMHGDPWAGVHKSCVAYVLRKRSTNGSTSGPYYLQARYAGEGEHLDFGTDIERIDIGPEGKEKALSESAFNLAYAMLFPKISKQSEFKLDFSTGGATLRGIDDPAPGDSKVMLIQYRSSRGGLQTRRFVEYQEQRM